MHKINIEINQAKLLSYSVDMDDDRPKIIATIGLFAGKKKISSFTLTTESYYSNSMQFELPVDLIVPIKDVARELEIILTRECNKQLKQLEAPKKESDIPEIDDSDIPF